MKTHKRRLLPALCAALALSLAACAKEPTPEPPVSGAAGDTEAAVTTDSASPAGQEANGYRTVTLQTVSLRTFVWDDSRLLFVCANPDEGGNLTKITLHLFDNRRGEMIDVCDYPEQHGPDLFCYADDADSMFLYDNDGKTYRLTLSGGSLSLSESEKPQAAADGAAVGDRRFSSPDGTMMVYRNVNGGTGFGSVILRRDGASRTILTDVPYTEEVDAARSYVPVGFIDATHIVYAINGWEWSLGYGVIDAVSGEKSEFEVGGMHLMGVYNGMMYLTQMQNHRVTALYKMDSTSVMTVLASEAPDAGTERAVFFGNENIGVYFVGGRWIAIDFTTGSLTVFSEDVSEKLLEIEQLPMRLFHMTVTDAGELVLVSG